MASGKHHGQPDRHERPDEFVEGAVGGSSDRSARGSEDMPHTSADMSTGTTSGRFEPTGGAWRWLTRAVLLLLVAGALAQVFMSAYYLAVAHSPTPHAVPVGLVATDETAAATQVQIEQDGKFDVRRFATVEAMTAAIKDKTVYGGVDIARTQPQLYIASAAGTAAANTLRTAFTQVVQDQKQQQVEQLAAAGQVVPIQQVEALAAAPAVIDVVPLPAHDSVGAALGLLVQALALGATVASMGLGRVGPHTAPSLRRAVGHVAALVIYSVVSAGAVLLAAHAFGVIPEGSDSRLFIGFALLSFAITGSVAGLVALIGPAGAALGTAYFLFGVPIAGASVLPEFLPGVARVVGQALPTGAGVTAVRDGLYFPDAPVGGPLLVLSAYATVGAAIVVVSNAVGNKSGRRHLFDLRRDPREAN